MLNSPFKFLDSYNKEDKDIFFGREIEIEELYHRVFESKILLVYGTSGTGKSSLINCGLANKFQDFDWLPVNVRRGVDIVKSMAVAIGQLSTTPTNKRMETVSEFKKAVRSLYLDYYKPIYFIFDQFEELFIFGSVEERKSFMEIVNSLINSDLQCRFIFVLREEYLANLTEFENKIPTFLANRVRIEKMTISNAKQVIEGPCNVFGITVEENFSEALLESLCPECVDVELTYLQVYLDKIYRLAIKNNSDNILFEKSLLEQTGNVSDLLGAFLDDQISMMDNPHYALTVLKSFVSVKGTKRQMNIEEVKDYVHLLGISLADEVLQDFIQTFIHLRILRDKDQSGRYELRHDALAAKVYDKITLSEKEMLELKQFIEDSYNSYSKRGLLFSNEDLEFIGDRDSNLKLNDSVLQFIDKSRKYKKAKERTVKQLTWVSVIVFIILLMVIGVFVNNNLNENYAIENAFSSLTQNQDLKERYYLAKDAWDTYKCGETQEAMVNVVNDILYSDENDSLFIEMRKKYLVRFDEAPENINFAECSNDDKYIVGYSDNYILIWSNNGKLVREIRLNSKPLISLKISDDNSYIGGVSADSILTIWNFSGEILSKTKISYNKLNTRQIFEFTKNNRVFALSPDFDAILIDSLGNQIQTLKHHTGSVNSIDVSNSNKFVATASSDKTIDIWYYNSVKNRYDLYNTLSQHKDTVWSASFANNNFYVITSSSDSCVFIIDINNTLHSDFYVIAGEKNRRICFSQFASNDKGVFVQRYDNSNDEIKLFNTGYFYGFGIETLEESYPKESEFNNFTISSKSNYFAYSKEEVCFLLMGELNRPYRILLKEIGRKPFFSKQEMFFYTINRNKIFSYYIDVSSLQ